MDASRFDRLTRAFSIAKAPRRQTLIALVLGAGGLRVRGSEIAAGPGCKNVGKKCKKKKDCCSGICMGKKGRKKCKAHDTGGCQAGQQEQACGGTTVECITSTGNAGACNTTTGNAGYCVGGGDCFQCAKDADCRPFCGPAAACIRCEPTCFGVGGTACFGPDACDFSDSE